MTVSTDSDCMIRFQYNVSFCMHSAFFIMWGISVVFSHWSQGSEQRYVITHSSFDLWVRCSDPKCVGTHSCTSTDRHFTCWRTCHEMMTHFYLFYLVINNGSSSAGLTVWYVERGWWEPVDCCLVMAKPHAGRSISGDEIRSSWRSFDLVNAEWCFSFSYLMRRKMTSPGAACWPWRGRTWRR